MSAADWRAVTHCLEHIDLPVAWERHVHRASHVAPKQPGLESSRLRCLGCPSNRTHNSTSPRTSLAESSGENPVPVVRSSVPVPAWSGTAIPLRDTSVQKWVLVADSDPRVRQHSSYHPPVDPLSATERSLRLLHVPGIYCHPVFGLRRRWDPSVII